MKNKKKQPIPKPGLEFTGWATFNWGICHRRVYRTKKEARESLTDGGYTWNEIKDYMIVVKVKCTVIDPENYK